MSEDALLNPDGPWSRFKPPAKQPLAFVLKDGPMYMGAHGTTRFQARALRFATKVSAVLSARAWRCRVVALVRRGGQ